MVGRTFFVALLSLSVCINARLAAQSAGSAASPPRCSSNGGRVIRAGAGAVLGAWLGFVGAKIKQSDWSDDSRSAAAHRSRNLATAGGAVIGVAIGGAPFWRRSCGAQVRQLRTSAPLSEMRQPITRTEIERFGVNGNVYDLVYSLRRSWLNTRGVETMSEAPRVVTAADGQEITVPGEPRLLVYLDNVRLGTLSQLRDLPVAGVTGLRYYNPAEATFRWGAGHSHGAIQVLTVTEPTDGAEPRAP